LSVEDLAEVAHLSPRQFSRAFQAETGQTPATAVENLRLEGARALMEDTSHTLDVVAQLIRRPQPNATSLCPGLRPTAAGDPAPVAPICVHRGN
jgi:hypothetical protein